ncbi:MAG: hypothetical protein PUA90_00710 [bacterium]|nr:hypothetical protein [bacterium]
MKTLKYGDKILVIEDDNSEGKTGIAIHNIDNIEDTKVIDTNKINDALEDTITDLELDLEEKDE